MADIWNKEAGNNSPEVEQIGYVEQLESAARNIRNVLEKM